MKRNDFLCRTTLIVAIIAMTLCVCGTPAVGTAEMAGSTPQRLARIEGFAARIRTLLNAGTLPIIDIEFHHGGNVETADLLAGMDRNGVALILLGPNERLGSAASIAMHEARPDRFVPTTMHGDGRLWHSRDPGFIDELARDVRSGNYFAMGEFEARHYPSNTNNRDVHLPVDSPYFEALFILSAETGMPFLIHHEAEDKLLAEMEHMLAKYPKAKVVWCHVGRNRNPETWRTVSRPEGVRALLNKYPNLYFDIVQSKPGSKYPWTGHVDAVIYASGRGGTGLDPAWKALFEEFPDRFMIGSDANTQRFHNYDQVMATFRDVVLTSLRRDVAERIAYKNAWKLITGQDWVK